MCVMRNIENPVRRSILVVEDEFLIAMSLKLILEEAGFDVVGPEYSVTAALEVLKHHRPAAGVLDVNLRGELAIPVARMFATMGVPFVISSAYAAQAATFDTAFADVPMLGKPIREAELIDTLDNILAADMSGVAPAELVRDQPQVRVIGQ